MTRAFRQNELDYSVRERVLGNEGVFAKALQISFLTECPY
jgi:hypothetical protein